MYTNSPCLSICNKICRAKYRPKIQPWEWEKGGLQSFSWFLSTNALPQDCMGNTTQWLFSSSDALPSREINAPFIFSHNSALKETAQKAPWWRKWGPSCQLHAAPPGRLFTSAPLLLLFHTLRDFTNCYAVAPRGEKIAENRMWIHTQLINTLGETCAATQAALTCICNFHQCGTNKGFLNLSLCCTSCLYFNETELFWNNGDSY